jgi:hypothetical protein
MSKVVDLNKTVYENFNSNRDGIAIMDILGFKNIIKPSMFSSMGKMITIKQGARLQNVDLKKVKEVFEAHHYQVVE